MTADVLTWSAPEGSLDLVLVAYLHLPAEQTTALLTRAVGWLRPGGRLLVLGHDVANPVAGVGGLTPGAGAPRGLAFRTRLWPRASPPSKCHPPPPPLRRGREKDGACTSSFMAICWRAACLPPFLRT